MDGDTLSYYNENAAEFFEGTVNVEFSLTQNKFLEYLDSGATILDLGCGSGRDTKYFLERNYNVEAIDGSAELCRLASDFAGIEVKNLVFDEFEEEDRYDGIWACSSILHISLDELKYIFIKIAHALRDKGIFYTSFKFGQFEGIRNGRYFTDMTEDRMNQLLDETNVFQNVEHWITKDVRPGREEIWLNIILRKK